jgi:hypothetical protein
LQVECGVLGGVVLCLFGKLNFQTLSPSSFFSTITIPFLCFFHPTGFLTAP